MELTLDQLKQLLPRNQYVEQWYNALSEFLPQYEIDTPQRIAQFMAQCGHESADFTRMQENLNYGAEGLANTWPKRYAVNPTAKPRVPNDLAKALARKPEAIANNCYANRNGNGPESSGDGWRYRGRGLIQITGKENYSRFASSVGMTLEDSVSYLETFEGAVQSACWFWQGRNINPVADAEDTLTVTKLINGGTNGLPDRQARYENAKRILES